MGTRADFYIKNKEELEWLGSIAWDGYPEGLTLKSNASAQILEAKDESDFRDHVLRFMNEREDSSYPKDGWPWPWDSSNTTDYSYIFDGKTFVNCFGKELVDDDGNPDKKYPSKKFTFPDMKNIQKVNFGKKSGLLVF